MKRLFFLTFLIINILPILAQHIDITGEVTDHNQEVLTGASISIYKQDSILLGGVISDDKGKFKLKDIPVGSYKIVVSYVGCTADFQALIYVAGSINLDFGKKKNTQQQRMNNQDSGSGILHSGKVCM